VDFILDFEKFCMKLMQRIELDIFVEIQDFNNVIIICSFLFIKPKGSVTFVRKVECGRSNSCVSTLYLFLWNAELCVKLLKWWQVCGSIPVKGFKGNKPSVNFLPLCLRSTCFISLVVSLKYLVSVFQIAWQGNKCMAPL